MSERESEKLLRKQTTNKDEEYEQGIAYFDNKWINADQPYGPYRSES